MMLMVKGKYMKAHRELMCRFCNNETESPQPTLELCERIYPDDTTKVEYCYGQPQTYLVSQYKPYTDVFK